MLRQVYKSINIIQDFRRLLSINLKEKLKENYKVKSWQIHSYGDINELQLNYTRIPVIQNPNDILINVEAASINPIDLLMMSGYGRNLFQIARKFELEFPLILGRDFSGTVVQKGHGVGDLFNIGEKVYGFIPIYKQGCFSEIVVADKSHICLQPPNLTQTQSASLVYATMTAWSALYVTGNMLFTNPKGHRVLVLGASGGVGTAAVQLLKSQACQVFATCATDAVPLVYSLGADCVFDYKEEDYFDKIAIEGHFHLILDCAKLGFENIPKSVKYCTYVALNSPLLLNTDKLGIFGGLLASTGDLLKANFKQQGKLVKWGFFIPSATGLKFIHKLILAGKIKPVIQKEFEFDKLPEALMELSKGHSRGKMVIKF